MEQVPSALVAVPTLGDRPDLLRETLASLARQGSVARVVVVTAKREVWLEELCASTGAELVLQGPTTGMSAAINQVWRDHGADHEFWTWLGDDDLLTPGSLERAVAALRADPGAVMVHGDCAWIDEAGRLKFVLHSRRVGAWTIGFGPNLVAQPGSLQRAAAVRAVGLLDEELRYAMDLDLFVRLRRRGRIVAVPEVQACFRMHEGSTTVGNLEASWAEAKRVQRAATGHPRAWPVASKLAWAVYPHIGKLISTPAEGPLVRGAWSSAGQPGATGSASSANQSA